MSSTLYRRRIQIAILALIILDIMLVVYSCQNRAKLNPIEGSLEPTAPGMLDSVYQPPVYVTGDADEDGIITAGTGSMGTFHIYLDTRNNTAELTPIRAGQAVGDDFIVDITNFLNGSPCVDCFKIESVGLNPLSELEVEFSLRHPFALPANNPPVSRDRLDLHVFDVQGIFFFSERKNSTAFPSISNAVGGLIGDISTMEADNSGFWASHNWDGFTDHFNDYVNDFFRTTTNLHPYLIFFEDPTTGNFDPTNVNGFTDLYRPTGHNVFSQGGRPDYRTVNFGLHFGSKIEFVVLLSAAYGQSARGWGFEPGQRANPRYFLPEFNRKEPWKVEVNIPPDTDLLESDNHLSSTVLNINVYDWQHSLGTLRGDYDPYTAQADSLKRSSKVKGVYVEIPGVNDLVQSTNPISGTGLGDDPLVYEIEITNKLGASQGRYTGLVAVVDELHGSYLGGYGVQRDGVTRFDVNRFATYAMFQVNVLDRGGGSFSQGFSMYGGDDGTGDDYAGEGIMLDSISGDNIAVHKNYVYVVGSILNARDGDSWDVYLMRSTNGGISFETPRKVSSDYPGGTMGVQNQPSISVAPDTGIVYLLFTDRSRNRSGSTADEIILRKSKDNGITFSSPGTRLNTFNGSTNSGVIKAGNGGNVWAAFVNQYESHGDNSQIVFLTSKDYGESFKSSFISENTHSLLTNPIILTPKEPASYPDLVGFIWREKSIYSPDIRFVSSFDGGMNFGYHQNISGDYIYQFATMPRAEMDSDGTIYCVYRINHIYDTPSSISMSLGVKETQELYTWMNANIKEEPDLLFGELDLFLSNSGNIFLCWNQLDDVNTIHGQDIFVYKGFKENLSFIEYARIEEPSDFFADQDMPRFTGDDTGKIYLIYRDNSFRPGGELFITYGYE